jgi:lia operon protein LiaG
MKKIVCLLVSFFLLLPGIFSQQYRTTISGKREYTLKLIDIEADLNVTSIAGNEIIIQATSLPETPDKAKGLRPLTKSGIDNTDIGLNTEIIEDVIAFTGGKSGENLKYEFKIPGNVNLYINNPSFSRTYDRYYLQ